MDISLTTAVIGGIDSRKEIPQQTVRFTRFFYEEPQPFIRGNDRMKALWYKTHILTYEHDVSIWLDGKIQPLSEDFIQQIIEALGNGEIAILKHAARSCIYQEVNHIVEEVRRGSEYLIPRYLNKPLRSQAAAYRYFGYPKNNGLFDCCIIAAKPSMRKIFDLWWHDVYQLNGFDQIALPFYCWQAGVKIRPIVFRPDSFLDIPHEIIK